MNALTPSAAAITPVQDLRLSVIDEFITTIDRTAQTEKTYANNVRQFVAFLRYQGIRRPARQDIIFYRQWLSGEHDAIQIDPGPDGWVYRTDRTGCRYTITCKPYTVKQYLQTVRQLFAWTAAAGYYPNIAAGIHAPKVRQDVHKKDALRPADVLAIERHIMSDSKMTTEQRLRLTAMYTLAVTAGLRTVELSRANIKDIETRGGRAVMYIWGKGHTEPDTAKPLAPEVYDAIREYLDARTDDPTKASPLFVSTGNRSGGKRIAPTTISKMLKHAMQAAGYDSERITAHTLRHTAGTAVMELTGNLYATQTYMRHASPATTEIYLHVETEKAEARTADLLYQYYHADQPIEDKGSALPG